MISSAKIDIEELVEHEIPPLPSSVAHVLDLTHDENRSARDIANAIGADPALTVKVLRIANSPIYFFTREITNLLVAVNTLGNGSIRTLLITSFMSDAFGKNFQKAPQAGKLWTHSVAVGLAARELSTELGMRSREEAFVCGLLHDLGKLALICHDPEFYQYISTSLDEHEIMRSEMDQYGYSHAQVGAIMAKRWGLPKEIANAIYYHHQPGEAGEFAFISRIIDVADQIANKAGWGIRQLSEDYDIPSSESAICLKLEQAQLDAALERTTKSLELMLEKLR